MKVSFGFFDDETAVACVAVFHELAKNNGHVDQIVESEAVLIDFKLISREGKPAGEAFEIARAESDFQGLRKSGTKHVPVSVSDGGFSCRDWRVSFEACIDPFEDSVQPFLFIIISE